jgi:hypothetical protein
LEAPPGDEGVLPGPSGLRIAEQDLSCASGGCARVVNATGDHARESMRAYLAAQGFTPRTAIVTYVDERMCRLTGVVVAHEVCVELRDISAATVQISWYLD